MLNRVEEIMWSLMFLGMVVVGGVSLHFLGTPLTTKELYSLVLFVFMIDVLRDIEKAIKRSKS